MKPSDDELMNLISQGDKMAFAQLFERHAGQLLGYSRSYLGSQESSEDVTQEIWMKVIHLSSSYKGQGQFRAWLFTLTRNRCLNILRDQKKFVYQDTADKDFDLPSMQEMESEILNQQDLRKIQKNIEALPETQRVALLLHVVEGLSYDEVGSEMNLSVSSVKSLIFRARTNLVNKNERSKP